MLGTPIVDITMDADQSAGLGAIGSGETRVWTRLSPWSIGDGRLCDVCRVSVGP